MADGFADKSFLIWIFLKDDETGFDKCYPFKFGAKWLIFSLAAVHLNR